MQEAQARPMLKRVRERTLLRRKRREERKVFDLEYDNAEKLTAVKLNLGQLALSGFEFIQLEQYCGPCKKPTGHGYYQFDNTVRCIVCDNYLGENDPRPLAPVVLFP